MSWDKGLCNVWNWMGSYQFITNLTYLTNNGIDIGMPISSKLQVNVYALCNIIKNLFSAYEVDAVYMLASVFAIYK